MATCGLGVPAEDWDCIKMELLKGSPPARGLVDDVICQIVEDDMGDFWFGCSRGVFRVRKTELYDLVDGRVKFVHPLLLGTAEGLASAQCSGGFCPAGLKTKSGLVCFSTLSGIVQIDPTHFKEPDPPPQVTVTELVVDGERRRLSFHPSDLTGSMPEGTNVLKLGPGKQSFEFHYTSLGFINPERILFKHCLKGFDNWVEAGNARIAVFRNVPPGTYQFQVLACNSDGIWSSQKTCLTMVVEPFWWQRGWFHILVVFMILLGIFGFFGLRIRALQRARQAQEAFSSRLIELQETERKRIAAELHDGLGQELLLIKNRLQVISGIPDQQERVVSEVKTMAQTTSRAITDLRAMSSALRPITLEQIGLTKAIQWMAEQVAAASTVKFEILVENVDGVLKPDHEIHFYRIIQEGLNNIVKHSEATEATLEVSHDEAGLQMSLFDNGKGFDLKRQNQNGMSRSSFGLTSMTERAKVLGGKLDVLSSLGRGTRLVLLVPLTPEYEHKQ